MLKVIVSEKAASDLEDIYVFGIYQFGRSQARKYFDELFVQMHKLGKSPNLGRPMPELGQEIFMMVYKSHLIFYEIKNDIKILRVLHGSRNYQAGLDLG